MVVTHVTPIKMLLRQALAGGPRSSTGCTWTWRALRGHFYPDGGACVRLVNDTSHRTA